MSTRRPGASYVYKALEKAWPERIRVPIVKTSSQYRNARSKEVASRNTQRGSAAQGFARSPHDGSALWACANEVRVARAPILTE
eukprot:6045951-Pleurochrysis_carterae.AAC.1